ncbi:Maltose O-acetyltransferase [Phycisphaerales bacterium]|nr:Maltose O-acetyltransferase [Phycisphaerales bacterium]
MPRPLAAITRSWTGPHPPVSVIVLTLNEEINLAECLESCGWSDDVHVLDSGSADSTEAIAKAAGVGWHVNPFESFGAQRNWAIDHIPLRHEWVFHLDADERFTPELVRALAGMLEESPAHAGFYVPNQMILMGSWIRRASGYPTYQMRFFHKARMRFADHGHGQRESTAGTLGTLDAPYLHHNFSKGLDDWFERHNRYSTLEARQIVSEDARPAGVGELFASDRVTRRRALKRVAGRLPLRPMLRWLHTMFAMGAVLEGRPGLTYARLLAAYERMIDLKVEMLRRAPAGGPVAPAKPAPPMAARQRGPTPVPADWTTADPARTVVPAPSGWTTKQKIVRAMWMLVGAPMFRLSFHNWYGFRAMLLRMFGAKVGRGTKIRPTSHIEIPWNLEIGDGVMVGDGAILYALGPIRIGDRAVVSQLAHLCAGTHDYTTRAFPLLRDPIEIGPDAWIGADAFVGPNVIVGRLAVLGARSSAYRNLEPEWIHVGNPARPLRRREIRDAVGAVP